MHRLPAAPSDRLVLKHFVNATPPVLTAIALTGGPYPSAAMSAQQPYVVHRTVTNPAYLNSAASAYTLELTFPSSAGSVLDLFALNLYYNINR